jgi:hypothetical protein
MPGGLDGFEMEIEEIENPLEEGYEAEDRVAIVHPVEPKLGKQNPMALNDLQDTTNVDSTVIMDSPTFPIVSILRRTAGTSWARIVGGEEPHFAGVVGYQVPLRTRGCLESPW